LLEGFFSTLPNTKKARHIKEKKENARKMKDKGFPVDVIADITSLHTEDIDSL